MLLVLNKYLLLVWVELSTLQGAQHQATHPEVHVSISATVEAECERDALRSHAPGEFLRRLNLIGLLKCPVQISVIIKKLQPSGMCQLSEGLDLQTRGIPDQDGEKLLWVANRKLELPCPQDTASHVSARIPLAGGL